MICLCDQSNVKFTKGMEELAYWRMGHARIPVIKDIVAAGRYG